MEEEEEKLDENDRELKKKIKDWGLSHTTLEEVFMKVIFLSNNLLKYFFSRL